MRPLSTHSSPSLRAVVVMLWVLVPASGSVIAKAIVRGAVADAGQPPLLLLLGAVAGDDGAADRRADDHEQQRAALGGELLAHRGDVADPAAPAAVLLGDVDAEVAVLADLQPQVRGLAARARLLGEVVAAVLAGELRHLLAQRLALLGLAERVAHSDSSDVSTTARTSPAATCWPGFTSISVTVPACGALTRCCIFIASSTRTGCAGLDLLAGLDGDADDGAGHRCEQAAGRDRVGGVDEARRTPQRDVSARPVDIDLVTDDRDVVRRAHAARLEDHVGRARRDHRASSST